MPLVSISDMVGVPISKAPPSIILSLSVSGSPKKNFTSTFLKNPPTLDILASIATEEPFSKASGFNFRFSCMRIRSDPAR